MKIYVLSFLILMFIFSGCLNQTQLSPQVEKCKITTSDGIKGIDINCVANTAVAENNVSLCLNGLSSENADNCLLQYVSLTNDTSACQYIQNAGAAVVCNPPDNLINTKQEPPDPPTSLSEKAAVDYLVVQNGITYAVTFEIVDDGMSVNPDGVAQVKIFDQSKQIFETSFPVDSGKYSVFPDTLLYLGDLNITKDELKELTQSNDLQLELTFIGGGQTLTASTTLIVG